MVGDRSIKLVVNGVERDVSVSPDTPLLYVLRDCLGLLGTRFGCGQGACGACMVIVDGRAMTSCDMTVEAAAGRRIETVEALGTPDNPEHPLARAVLAEQAAQCGYCLPGILMAAKALLDATPEATGAELRAALDGNLCRCGAHARILRAVASAAREATGR